MSFRTIVFLCHRLGRISHDCSNPQHKTTSSSEIELFAFGTKSCSIRYPPLAKKGIPLNPFKVHEALLFQPPLIPETRPPQDRCCGTEAPRRLTSSRTRWLMSPRRAKRSWSVGPEAPTPEYPHLPSGRETPGPRPRPQPQDRDRDPGGGGRGKNRAV